MALMGLAAIAASLLGVTGLAGPSTTQLLLAFGALVALQLSRSPRED